MLALLGVPLGSVDARQAPDDPFPAGQPTPFDADGAAQAGQDAVTNDNRPQGIGGPELGPVPSFAAGSGGLALNFATHRVFATRYDPHVEGSIEVAIPDQCAKFAALGQSSTLRQFNCPSGYSLGLDYRVVVTRENGQSLTIPVKDVGPWNVDDNYWAGPNSPRPRRMFTDLPVGLPEAQAAFQSGYNTKANCTELDATTATTKTAGTDQFGRCVLNPAGIDLSTAAAAPLGMGNEFVTVTFLWERLQPLVVAMASQDDPGGLTRLGVINSCGAAYVKNGALSEPFQQQLNCGDGLAVTLGGDRMGVMNSCGALYVKEGELDTPFHQQLNCGDGRLVVLSSGRRVGVINGCGAAYVKEGELSGPFHQQTACGDSQTLDVSTRRVAIINGCGALYVKEPGVGSDFQLQMACGDAVAVAVSANRLGVVSGCGAFLVKEGPLSGELPAADGLLRHPGHRRHRDPYRRDQRLWGALREGRCPQRAVPPPAQLQRRRGHPPVEHPGGGDQRLRRRLRQGGRRHQPVPAAAQLRGRRVRDRRRLSADPHAAAGAGGGGQLQRRRHDPGLPPQRPRLRLARG